MREVGKNLFVLKILSVFFLALFFKSEGIAADGSIIVNDSDKIISVGDFFEGIKRRLNGDYTRNPTFFLQDTSEGSLVEIYFSDGRGGVITQKVYDSEQLFFRDNEFLPAILNKGDTIQGREIKVTRANGGTRAVGIYEHTDNKLCFKQWPEAPNIEILTHEVFKGVFGTDNESTPMPAAEVILINKMPFLVSQFMEGESFEDVLRSASSSEAVCNFSLSEFQRLVIYSWLTVPEDGGARNLLFSQGRIKSIDNERGFGKVVTELDEEGRRTRCHFALFHFTEMFKYRIADSVFDAIMTRKEKFFESLERINNEHTYQLALDALIDGDKNIEGDKKRTTLGITGDRNAVKTMIKRIDIFLYQMKINRNASLANIFREVAGELIPYYEIQAIEADSQLPESVSIKLKDIFDRITNKEPGRIGPQAPTSAYVPLESYRGSEIPTSQMMQEALEYMCNECPTLTTEILKLFEIKGSNVENSAVREAFAVIRGNIPAIMRSEPVLNYMVHYRDDFVDIAYSIYGEKFKDILPQLVPTLSEDALNRFKNALGIPDLQNDLLRNKDLLKLFIGTIKKEKIKDIFKQLVKGSEAEELRNMINTLATTLSTNPSILT